MCDFLDTASGPLQVGRTYTQPSLGVLLDLHGNCAIAKAYTPVFASHWTSPYVLCTPGVGNYDGIEVLKDMRWRTRLKCPLNRRVLCVRGSRYFFTHEGRLCSSDLATGAAGPSVAYPPAAVVVRTWDHEWTLCADEPCVAIHIFMVNDAGQIIIRSVPHGSCRGLGWICATSVAFFHFEILAAYDANGWSTAKPPENGKRLAAAAPYILFTTALMVLGPEGFYRSERFPGPFSEWTTLRRTAEGVWLADGRTNEAILLDEDWRPKDFSFE
jgi:hypothetical protein